MMNGIVQGYLHIFFLQVHLFEENKIALTLNNNDTVLQCLITATIGQGWWRVERDFWRITEHYL